MPAPITSLSWMGKPHYFVSAPSPCAHHHGANMIGGSFTLSVGTTSRKQGPTQLLVREIGRNTTRLKGTICSDLPIHADGSVSSFGRCLTCVGHSGPSSSRPSGAKIRRHPQIHSQYTTIVYRFWLSDFSCTVKR